MDIIPFNGRSYTRQVLEGMSISELVDLHNRIAGFLEGVNDIKTFRDKPTALDRVWKLLTQTNSGSSKQESQMTETTETKQKRVRSKHFNFPFAGEIKECRGDTLRSRVVDLLKGDGASFEQVVETVKKFDAERGVAEKNVERRAYEVVRILHYYLGYGLKQDETGKIHLVTA